MDKKAYFQTPEFKAWYKKMKWEVAHSVSNIHKRANTRPKHVAAKPLDQ